MTTLQELLAGQDASRIATMTPTGTKRLGELLEAASHMDPNPPPQVRVVAGDINLFITELLRFDGRVRSMIILPASWTRDGVSAACCPEPPATGPTDWVLATSGTTGVPKFVSHTFQSLTSTTKAAPAGGPSYRWGLLYDPGRFAGLQVLLQALVGEAPLVAPNLDDLTEAVRFMAEHGVTAMSATPSLWRKLLMTRGIETLSLRQITLGGEIADANILGALRNRFPYCRIVHIYASTEAGVGFSVADGLPGFPEAYLREGTLNGVDLRVSEDGHLWIRGPGPLPLPGAGSDGFMDTGDLVRKEGGRVHFLGRARGMINVGGDKVMPEEVEAVLCTHPMVVTARVFGKRSSILGHMVAAEVQLRPEAEEQKISQELMNLCRGRLPRVKWPASIQVVSDLEVGAAGKIMRKESNHD